MDLRNAPAGRCVRGHWPARPATGRLTPSAAQRLIAAECAAEAPAAGVEPEDLQQAVWLRWLERENAPEPQPEHDAPERPGAAGGRPPSPHGAGLPPAGWLRGAVRAEARRARRRAARETPWPAEDLPPAGDGGRLHEAAEAPVLRAEHRRVLAAAVARLPGRCPGLLGALLSRQDLTYPEIARELGMSQGSLGPVRSRCLGCLRRMLTASDCGT